jgi:hypothetical protein
MAGPADCTHHSGAVPDDPVDCMPVMNDKVSDPGSQLVFLAIDDDYRALLNTIGGSFVHAGSIAQAQEHA